MAGDWLKWCKGLTRKREVVLVAGRLGMHRRQVAGTYMEFAEWADDETTDGRIAGVTAEYIDDLVTTPGFARALEAVGWLRFTEDGILIPNFKRHNGQTAKTRARNQRNQRVRRVTVKSPPRGDAAVTKRSPEKSLEQAREPRARSEINPSGLASAGSVAAPALGLAAWLQSHGIRNPKQDAIIARANGTLSVATLDAEWADIVSAADVRSPEKVLLGRLCQRFGIELKKSGRLGADVAKFRDDLAQLRARNAQGRNA